jgi:hypothetical protein
LLAAIAVGVVVTIVLAATRPTAPAGTALGRADKVVLVGVPLLRLDDLGRGDTPALDRRAATGGLAGMVANTVRTRPTTAEIYTSLGAGYEASVAPPVGLAYDADEPIATGEAGRVFARLAGTAAPAGVVVMDAPATMRTNQGKHRSSLPGALGDALRRAGKRPAVFGNADTTDPVTATEELYRPAAMALMDRDGIVPGGSVEPGAITVRDPHSPGGVRMAPAQAAVKVLDTLPTHDVVLVDGGDFDRIAALRPSSSVGTASRLKRQALRRVDTLAGILDQELDDRTLLVVVGLDTGAGGRHLTPVIARGPGVRAGYLASGSTGRYGVVALADLAPTVLQALGVPVPDGMVGRPLRSLDRSGGLGHLRDVDQEARLRDRVAPPVSNAFITAQVLFYAFAVFALSRWGRRDRSTPVLRAGALALAAFPLATFVLRLVPSGGLPEAAAAAAVVGLSVALAIAARVVADRSSTAVVVLAAATVWLLLADLLTGTRLQISSVLGSSLLLAARFRGLGNAGLGVLAGALLVTAAAVVDRARDRRRAVRLLGALFVLTVVVVGLPALGAKVGGIIVLSPVLAVTWWLLSGRRLTRWLVAAAVALPAAGLAAAALVDLLSPAARRSHLGRFAGAGEGGIVVTVARKLSTALRVVEGSNWTDAAVVLLAFVAVLLLMRRDLAPRGSTVRLAVGAVVAAAVIGVAANDAGILVAALSLGVLAPWLVTLATERDPGWMES